MSLLSIITIGLAGLGGLVNGQRDLSVELGVAGNFAILAQAGISSVPDSAVLGDIGVSPAAATYITGFGLSQDSSTTYATSPQVTGLIYAGDYSTPTPVYLAAAVANAGTAYNQAAGFTDPDFVELGAGELRDQTLVPGLYKWSSSVSVPTDLVFEGNGDATWVLQIGGGLSLADGVAFSLAGGANSTNIAIQVADDVRVGKGAHFEGVLLAQRFVTLQTGSSLNGRVLSQTEVALQKATVNSPFVPAPEVVQKRSNARQWS
uniref:Antifreeze protein n=1 Tax=Glaciozyma antarctica TaxID=105987 RepID=I1E4B7_9BASI|nr:antifreeze protein [Glaciozyma antarctica]